MLDFLAFALRAAAGAALVAAGIAAWNAAPDPTDRGTSAAVARLACEADWAAREFDAARMNPEAAARRRAEFQNRCPAGPRTTWDAAGRDRALMFGGGALALFVVGTMLASAARRERLAAETLQAIKQRATHR
jgi:hypothetical protein